MANMEVVGYVVGFFSFIILVFTGILGYLAWERKRWADEIIARLRDKNSQNKDTDPLKRNSQSNCL